LAYLYICYGKYDEALILHRALGEFFPEDVEVILGLTFSLYFTGRQMEAAQCLDKLDGIEMDIKCQKLFFLLRSHVSWGVGRDSDARVNLIHYLGLVEKEVREREASVGKGVEEYS
jgi:hypothetical protein